LITPLGFAALGSSTPPERLGQTMGAAELGREVGDAGLLSEPALLAVPADHPLARLSSITAADLGEQTFLFAQNLPDYWIDHHLPTTDSAARITSLAGFQEMLAYVVSGHGVAVVGAQTEHFYPRPNLTCVPPRRRPYLRLRPDVAHRQRARPCPGFRDPRQHPTAPEQPVALNQHGRSLKTSASIGREGSEGLSQR
jgi:DNA-binding transcriptional LysR family regulator